MSTHLSGRGGWRKQGLDRQPTHKTDLVRCPTSWWMASECQANREAFTERAKVERPRIARYGKSPDKLVFDK